jgi:hypothetical protein
LRKAKTNIATQPVSTNESIETSHQSSEKSLSEVTSEKASPKEK